MNQMRKKMSVYNLLKQPFLWRLTASNQRPGIISAINPTRMACTGNSEISHEDLKALLEKNKNLLLVDVRTKEEVDKGRIPGSIHIHVDSVEAAFSMEPEEFKAKYGVTKPSLDVPELVFHCQMGMRGGRATSKAQELGYVNAQNYKGGYAEWSSKEGK
ncbi:thiosulfate:glutathione sulfurtransferase [Xyrichtys novacula]|uniref:Thiosulfate:glutathione sulfurtransferase n=1 Tax=Xyrichtys novacula TaxID=13765 RepID=A0AAV1FBS8_XYRNO|nr:thiosulfate:glutathione sulfurtransferase [Xyrichtys novacula]